MKLDQVYPLDRHHPLIAARSEATISEVLRASRPLGRPLGDAEHAGPALSSRLGMPEHVSRRVLDRTDIGTIANQAYALAREHAVFLDGAERKDLIGAVAERLLLATESNDERAWRVRFAGELATTLQVSPHVGLYAAKAPSGPNAWTDRVVSRAVFAAGIELDGGGCWDVEVQDLAEGEQTYQIFAMSEGLAISEAEIAAIENGCRLIDEVIATHRSGGPYKPGQSANIEMEPSI